MIGEPYFAVLNVNLVLFLLPSGVGVDKCGPDDPGPLPKKV